MSSIYWRKYLARLDYKSIWCLLMLKQLKLKALDAALMKKTNDQSEFVNTMLSVYYLQGSEL